MQVIEARGLRKSRIMHHKYLPYVSLQLEKHHEMTETSDKADPVWNKEFTMHHASPDATLELIIAGKRYIKRPSRR